jgi:hypothetical protein
MDVTALSLPDPAPEGQAAAGAHGNVTLNRYSERSNSHWIGVTSEFSTKVETRARRKSRPFSFLARLNVSAQRLLRRRLLQILH